MQFGSAWACGYGPGDGGFFRFFEPNRGHRLEFTGFAAFSPWPYDSYISEYPFFNSSEEDLQAVALKEANIESWYAYFRGRCTRAEIANRVYQAAPYKRVTRDDSLRGWSPEVMQYLAYAWQCEPLCAPTNHWDNATIKVKNIDSLPQFQAGLAAYKTCKSGFLKLRYAYQLVRLCHYSKAYNRGIALFESHARPVLVASEEMAGWAYGHYAGCLLAKGRKVEAAYAYSRQYALSKSRRLQARWSWRIRTDEQWQALLERCEDDRQRADNYSLRAQALNAKPLVEMPHMLRLDPGREDLPVLIAREINKLEMGLLGPVYFEETSFESRLRSHAFRPSLRKDIANLRGFLEQGLQSGGVNDPAFWSMSHSYLNFLDGDFDAAKEEMDSLLPTLHGEARRRGRRLALTIELVAAPRVTARMERKYAAVELAKHFPNSDSLNDFIDFRDAVLYWKYLRQGDTLMATLLRNPVDLTERWGIPMAFFEDLLALNRKAEKTPLESELTDRMASIDGHPPYWWGSTPRAITDSRIRELMATTYLAQGQLDSAIAIYAAIGHSSPPSAAAGDPFAPRIDWHHDGEIPFRLKNYTRLDYARTLRSLQKAAERPDSLQAHRYLLLGNAALQTLEDMPGRGFVSYQWCSGWHFGFELAFLKEYEILGHKGLLWPRNLDTGPARNYYNKCLAATKDPELQALAYIMLSQCESFDWGWAKYIEDANFDAKYPYGPYEFVDYKDRNRAWEQYMKVQFPTENEQAFFRILKERYSTTAVVAMLKRECAYYKWYDSH